MTEKQFGYSLCNISSMLLKTPCGTPYNDALMKKELLLFLVTERTINSKACGQPWHLHQGKLKKNKESLIAVPQDA